MQILISHPAILIIKILVNFGEYSELGIDQFSIVNYFTTFMLTTAKRLKFQENGKSGYLEIFRLSSLKTNFINEIMPR